VDDCTESQKSQSVAQVAESECWNLRVPLTPCAHGCRSSKEVKKCQAKQADNYEEDEAKSLQLTSSAFMAAPPTFTTITGHEAVSHWCNHSALTDCSPKGLSLNLWPSASQ